MQERERKRENDRLDVAACLHYGSRINTQKKQERIHPSKNRWQRNRQLSSTVSPK